MKLSNNLVKFGLPLTLLVASSSLNAASLAFRNASGPTTNDIAIVSSEGKIFNGFAALFTFTSVPASVSELAANGDNGLLDSIGVTGAANRQGVVSTSFDFPNVAGQPLYVVVGNGTSVGDSTELALFTPTGLPALTGSDDPVPQSLGTYTLAGDGITIGTTGGTDTFDHSGIFGPTGAARTLGVVQLVAVPEPSSVLLSGLALLAFAGRRKRA